MSLETGIPDGEYELELSEVVQNYIQVAQDSRIKPIQRLNDEILSIRCMLNLLTSFYNKALLY